MTGALLNIRMSDIVHGAQRDGASDVHVVPNMRPVMRIDGELHQIDGAAFGADDVRSIAASIFDPDELEAIESGRDLSKTCFGQSGSTLRVHGLRSSDGVALAIRLLPSGVPRLGDLGLPVAVTAFAKREGGLIVFAGPTGSGKSTSLAALIGEINGSQKRRIITIEDPIEYRHTSERAAITQRQVGVDAHSYESAVYGALRADPDVIVIGEMRESDTIRAALVAAETGHLVLTTLHTGSAAQAVDRIVDAFRESERAQVRAQLACGLTAIVCQRLVPNAHGAGRHPVVEILVATEAIRSMIRDGRTHLIQNAISTGRPFGMQTFEQHLAELAQAL